MRAVARECDAAFADVVLAHELDRVGNGEIGGGVARALPLRARDERRRLAVSPADDGAVDALLPVAAHVQEAGALRRAEPLVAVAGVEVRAERVEVEVDVRRRVRAVDDRDEPFGVRARDDLLDGEEEAGLRGDVRDVDGARALGALREDAFVTSSSGSGISART